MISIAGMVTSSGSFKTNEKVMTDQNLAPLEDLVSTGNEFNKKKEYGQKGLDAIVIIS